MYYSKIDMLLKAAQLYGEDYPNDLIASGTNCNVITVQQLVDDGKVKVDGDKNIVEDPYSGKDMSNLKICIYKDKRRVYASVYGCSENKWMDNNVDATDYCSQSGSSYGAVNI